MRKILSFLIITLSIIFNSSLLINSPLRAAGKYKVEITFSLSKSSASPGDTFEVTMNAKNTDTVKFTLLGISVDMNDNIGENNVKINCVVSSGCDGLNWNQTFTNVEAGETKTAKMTFKIDPSATIGSKVGPSTIMVEIKAPGDTTTDKQNNVSNPSIKNWSISVLAPSTATLTKSPSPTPTKSINKTPTPKVSPTVISTPSTVPALPLLPESFYGEGSKTTDLSKYPTKESRAAVENFTIDTVSAGMIEYKEPINLSDELVVINLDTVIDMSLPNRIRVGADSYPELNKPARLTMRGLKFTSTPKILRDGVEAKDYVSNVNYEESTGTLTFDVTGFSTYEAVEGAPASSINNNKDTDKMSKGEKKTFLFIASMILILGAIVGGLGVFYCYKYKKVPEKK